MSDILPIIIMIIIIGIIIMFYRITLNLGKKFITSTRVYTILCGYFVILLISVIVFVVSPYSDSTLLLKELDTNKTPITYGMSYDILEEEVSIDSFNAYKDKEWEFEFNGEVLQIQSDPNNTADLTIIVERKGVMDGLVEVASYSAPSTVQKNDISNLLRSIQVRVFEENRLEITEFHDEVNIVSFSKEFVFNQFSKDSNGDELFSGARIDIGEKLLYIRIPNGVKIDNYDYLNVEYIK